MRPGQSWKADREAEASAPVGAAVTTTEAMRASLASRAGSFLHFNLVNCLRVPGRWQQSTNVVSLGGCMPGRGRASFSKRQKELSRQEKRREKEARKQQRKLDKQTQGSDEALDSPQQTSDEWQSPEPDTGLPRSE